MYFPFENQLERVNQKTLFYNFFFPLENCSRKTASFLPDFTFPFFLAFCVRVWTLCRNLVTTPCIADAGNILKTVKSKLFSLLTFSVGLIVTSCSPSDAVGFLKWDGLLKLFQLCAVSNAVRASITCVKKSSGLASIDHRDTAASAEIPAVVGSHISSFCNIFFSSPSQVIKVYVMYICVPCIWETHLFKKCIRVLFTCSNIFMHDKT